MLCYNANASPFDKQLIIVSQTGKTDFKTIQAAIKSPPDTATVDRLIYIKNGVYAERIFITKNHLVLLGEDKTTQALWGSDLSLLSGFSETVSYKLRAMMEQGVSLAFEKVTVQNSSLICSSEF